MAASVFAQEPVTVGSAYDANRNVSLWYRHVDGQNNGDTLPYSSGGATQYVYIDNGVFMVQGQVDVSNTGLLGGSFGFNSRMYLRDTILGVGSPGDSIIGVVYPGNSILGVGFWYDANESPLNNFFQQCAITLEILNDDWSLRINGFYPVSYKFRNITSSSTGPGSAIVFQGNNLITGEITSRLDEVAMKGIDVEIAHAISFWDAELFAGYYNFQGRFGGQIHGAKGGLRGFITENIAADVVVTNDPVFGTNVLGGITWFFGVSGAGHTSGDPLTIPVERRHQVVIRQVQTTVDNLVTLADGGVPITVTHVNDSGAAGTGTFLDPHGSLTAAAGATTDIVYVHSGTMFIDQSYQLAANQRLLGEGDNNQHLVNTDQRGTINLPAVNGIGNPRPVFNGNVPAFTVGLADNTEVSNFEITNPNTALFANTLAIGNVNVNRTMITAGTTGIDILGGTGQFTFTDVTITNPTTSALNVNGGSSNIDFGSALVDPPNGLFGASTISQGAAGSALAISGGHLGTFTQDAGSNITATNGTGLQFNNADGTYAFDGPTVLAGGDAGIDILAGSAGTFTFANTTITSPSGIALNVDGSNANIDYSGGSISQANNAAAVNVNNHNTGTIDIDVNISTTNGTGLQFNNADGTYIFNQTVGATTLNGGDAGIDILGGSDGIFTFAATTINNTANGIGVNINGGTALTTFNGPLSINTNNNTGFNANNTGLTTLAGATNSISATGGPAINANSTEINLTFLNVTSNNSGTDGISILNAPAGSSLNITGLTDINNTTSDGIEINSATGTFTFAQVDIDTTQGDGLNLSNITGTVTVNGGAIDDVQNSNDGINATNVTGLSVDGVLFGNNVAITGDGVQVNNTTLDLNNSTFVSTTGVTVDTTDSTLSGSGNIAVPFSCNVSGINSGTISFNGGANTCP